MSEDQSPGSADRPDAQTPGSNPQGPKPFARLPFVAIAVVLLILVGASVYSLVKLSSVQASLSHAQQQIRATKSELSAEKQQVSADEQQLSTLESTVNSLPSDPLSGFSSMVCSNPDVYDSSTGQTITAYHPCADKTQTRTLTSRLSRQVLCYQCGCRNHITNAIY